MSNEEPERSDTARRAAELALVRVVHHYGGKPEFVLLGGLVPALLCAGSGWRHAGTTDVDVQVDLEIARGSVEAGRLEKALRNAEFVPGGQTATPQCTFLSAAALTGLSLTDEQLAPSWGGLAKWS